MADFLSLTRQTGPEIAAVDAESTRALAVGTRLGDYEVVALAGMGGMGEVYRARDLRLDRDVALKVLRPGLDASTAELLLREAQSMARLQHPNVVTVYAVGAVEDRLYVAMEFVEGQTLRTWLEAAPRRRREVLEAYLGAGHGLAAVHQAGLVHGDFKPDNVLIGHDGRVRVTDFGLAGVSAGPDAEHGVPLELASTALRAVGGTPAYMAPEQHLRVAVDARADQFAFCVALWEALCGERPFGGDGLAELRANVVAARMQATPALPRWVRAVLRRGLAAEPERRWPSMDALLARLERGLVWRRRAPLVAVVIVGAAALLVLARDSALPGPKCTGAASHLAGVWDATTLAGVERAFLASGRPYAADTLARVSTRLDTYAGNWTAMRTEACAATEVRHEQSPALLDLRMECLDRRLGGLRALTALFAAGPDPGVVDRAVSAVAKLEPLDGCADAEALRQAMPMPADAAARARIVAAYAGIQQVGALRLGGKFKDAQARVRPIVAEADATGYLPLQVAALTELSGVQAALRAIKDQEATLHRLIEVASRAKDDARVARSWATLCVVVGYYEDRPEEALALRPAAEAALVRAGETDEQRALLLVAIGHVYLAKHDPHAAARALAQAVALRERAPDPNEEELAGSLNALGVAQKDAFELDEALATFRRGSAIAERMLGSSHPFIGGRLLNIGSVLFLQGKLDEARALEERALAIFEPVYGPDGLDLALVLTNLADLDLDLARDVDAEREAQRAVAIKEKALGPTHQALVTSLNNLGRAQAGLGKLDAAEATHERERAIAEKSPGPGSEAYANALDSLAQVAMRRGRFQEAVALEQRAVAIYEKAAGTDNPQLARPLANLGTCQLALGVTNEAAAALERSLRVTRGTHPADLAGAAFALARAHQALRVADARALAERARTGYAALGPARGARVAEIDRWLVAHP